MPKIKYFSISAALPEGPVWTITMKKMFSPKKEIDRDKQPEEHYKLRQKSSAFHTLICALVEIQM